MSTIYFQTIPIPLKVSAEASTTAAVDFSCLDSQGYDAVEG